jgi:hypothetical protein
MNQELRRRAEARLQEAAARLGLSDPRPAYRDRLRVLRERHTAAFDRAIAHYEGTVLPALADGPDPITTWTEYGAFLAGLTADGRSFRIDGTGRAATFRAPVQPNELVLFVPDDAATDVLVMTMPAAATPAQQATVDLLVGRKLSL